MIFFSRNLCNIYKNKDVFCKDFENHQLFDCGKFQNEIADS